MIIFNHQMLKNHLNVNLIFIFIVVLFFYKLDAEKTPSIILPDESACDQNKYFLCPTDNQCIPREWLADGEIDCKDGTDESEAIFDALQRQNNTNKIKSKVKLINLFNFNKIIFCFLKKYLKNNLNFYKNFAII